MEGRGSWDLQGEGRGGLSRLHLPWLFCAAGLTASPRSRRGAPLSAGSLFPGAAGPPCCLYCMFLYCMGIKVYKHMVLCQHGRLGQPTRRCAASPDPELTHQWARRPGANRLEHPGIATPQPPHHSALAPHLLPAPRSPARPLPSPCRGLSPRLEGPETSDLLAGGQSPWRGAWLGASSPLNAWPGRVIKASLHLCCVILTAETTQQQGMRQNRRDKARCPGTPQGLPGDGGSRELAQGQLPGSQVGL